jgi:predicted enzyme related to lactoylglutathione lyase
MISNTDFTLLIYSTAHMRVKAYTDTATCTYRRSPVNQGMRLLVYPVKDMATAKVFYRELLGVEPYADAPYYVGFRSGELEIGLDPHAETSGPLAYWEVKDIRARLQELLKAGAVIDQDVKDVGGGKLIAKAKDTNGNVIGLMQSP